MARAVKRNPVPAEFREVVAAALSGQLTLHPSQTLQLILHRLAKNGEEHVRLVFEDPSTAQTIPFELNLNARFPDGASVDRIKACFTASLKFGGREHLQGTKTCVARLDAGSHPDWHLHCFDSATGLETQFSDPRTKQIPGLALANLQDAVKYALDLFCRGRERDGAERFTLYSTVPAQAAALQLLVPGS